MPGEHVLDSYAVLAVQRRETGADQVDALLADETNTLHMSVINLGEVYYATMRSDGDAAAELAVSGFLQEPNVVIADATWERTRAAARIKAGGGLSYADAFAVALAQERSAPVVTGDPEFERAERRGLVQVTWLRGN